MSHFLLVYDIPERSGIENPSNFLRAFAIRINLSCWIVGENDIPYVYLRRIESQGAKWRIVKFDAGEGNSITQMALDAIHGEIAAVRERTARVCERAAERASQEAERNRTYDSLKTYRRRVAAQLKAMRRNLNSLKAAAARFGVDVSGRFTSANDYLRSLHTVCLQRAKTITDTVTELNRQSGGHPSTTAAGLANAVQTHQGQDTTPILVSADYLDENGKPRLAARIRRLFGEPLGGSYFA